MNASYIKSLQDNRELLYAWTMRTVRARYQQSLLGVLWTIAQPVAQVAIFTVVFTMIVPIDTGDIPYPVYNFAAMAPWLLFSTGLTDMVTSLVINMNLVTKIYFPREILVISAMLARLLDFFIALIVLLVLMIYFGMQIKLAAWFLLPIVVAVQLMLGMGLGFIGAALNVFYRDIQHVFTLVLRIWFYASPIIYPVTRVPERFQSIYYVNPVVGILEAYRSILLEGALPSMTLVPAAIVSFVIFIVGYIFFKRIEFRFADVV